MKLVDSSVWIASWRGDASAAALVQLIEDDGVLLHPWVLGELALGNLGRRRAAILHDLRLLPSAPLASFDEALALIDSHSLSGSGLGWVDLHLIASARLAACELWTLDQRLASTWRRMT